MSLTFVDEASVFREPGEFAALLERYRAGRTREQLLRAAGGQEMKDAWQACLLALGYQEWRRELTEVRICAPEQFPDFQLRILGVTFDFEATMVLEPGRRLGDEYRGDQTLGPPPIERPIGPLPMFDPTLLQAAVRAKAARGYDGHPHLAVYLNIGASGVAIGDAIRAAEIDESQAFESIWLIAGKHIGCVRTSSSLPSPGDWQRIPIV